MEDRRHFGAVEDGREEIGAAEGCQHLFRFLDDADVLRYAVIGIVQTSRQRRVRQELEDKFN